MHPLGCPWSLLPLQDLQRKREDRVEDLGFRYRGLRPCARRRAKCRASVGMGGAEGKEVARKKTPGRASAFWQAT